MKKETKELVKRTAIRKDSKKLMKQLEYVRKDGNAAR